LNKRNKQGYTLVTTKNMPADYSN